jgi:hypothetical protein
MFVSDGVAKIDQRSLEILSVIRGIDSVMQMYLDLAEALALHLSHLVEDLGMVLLSRVKVGVAKLCTVRIANSLTGLAC